MKNKNNQNPNPNIRKEQQAMAGCAWFLLLATAVLCVLKLLWFPAWWWLACLSPILVPAFWLFGLTMYFVIKPNKR